MSLLNSTISLVLISALFAAIYKILPGPNLAAVTGLHYTSSVLGPLVGPAAFGYAVDFWNSDLIASCAAAACLVAAGYFFAVKPPRMPLRRTSVCRPRSSRTNMPGFTDFSNGRVCRCPPAEASFDWCGGGNGGDAIGKNPVDHRDLFLGWQIESAGWAS